MYLHIDLFKIVLIPYLHQPHVLGYPQIVADSGMARDVARLSVIAARLKGDQSVGVHLTRRGSTGIWSTTDSQLTYIFIDRSARRHLLPRPTVDTSHPEARYGINTESYLLGWEYRIHTRSRIFLFNVYTKCTVLANR